MFASASRLKKKTDNIIFLPYKDQNIDHCNIGFIASLVHVMHLNNHLSILQIDACSEHRICTVVPHM